MTRINDFELSIAIKVAADRCLANDVDMFMSLDVKNTAVDPRVEKRVSRKLRFDEWKDLRRISAGMLKYAAIVLVSVISLFFALSMTIQPVRAAFFGAIVTWYENFIDVRYGGDVDGINIVIDEEALVPAEFSYLPSGWSITSEDKKSKSYTCTIENSEKGFIYFLQQVDYESGIGIDDGVHSEEKVYLKDDTIAANLFIYENGQFVLVWKDKYMYKIQSENLTLYEVINIAEGIE